MLINVHDCPASSSTMHQPWRTSAAHRAWGLRYSALRWGSPRGSAMIPAGGKACSQVRMVDMLMVEKGWWSMNGWFMADLWLIYGWWWPMMANDGSWSELSYHILPQLGRIPFAISFCHVSGLDLRTLLICVVLCSYCWCCCCCCCCLICFLLAWAGRAWCEWQLNKMKKMTIWPKKTIGLLATIEGVICHRSYRISEKYVCRWGIRQESRVTIKLLREIRWWFIARFACESGWSFKEPLHCVTRGYQFWPSVVSAWTFDFHA